MAKPLTEIVCDYKGNFLISGTKTKVLVVPINDPVILRSNVKDSVDAKHDLEQRASLAHTDKKVNAYNITTQGYQEGFWIGAVQYYRAAKPL